MKRTLLLSCLMTLAVSIWAQGPNGTGTYYKAADGKKGAALKNALHNILRNGYYTFVDKYGNERSLKYHMITYDSLYIAYLDTDLRPEDNCIWDMYSNTSNFKPSDNDSGYNCEAPGPNENGKDPKFCYNREHSVPQSWFDGHKGTIPYSDLFHVYPTDGYVNNRRGNYPFGEVGNVTWASHNRFSKLGSCATPGYSGTVFEPNDIYKGDFARSYFYMATCHQNVDFTKSDNGADVFEKPSVSLYPGIKEWSLNMFLDWAHNDTISEKEINRNEAVALYQYNRNPFIDYPGLEQYIWGSMVDVPFSYDNYVKPEIYTHFNGGGTPIDPDPPTPPTPAEGENLYLRIASVDDLEDGAGYIIVCEDQKTAMYDQNSSNYRNFVSLTTTDGAVTTAVNENGKPYEVTLGIVSGGYTLYDATTNVYLAHTKKENKLHTATSPTATGAKWTISFSGTDANIQNANTDYYIQYNSGAPRFSCYKSGQQPVQLYKRQPKADDGTTIAAFPTSNVKRNTVIYDLQGRPVGTVADGNLHLKKGIYIFGNRKVVIK